MRKRPITEENVRTKSRGEYLGREGYTGRGCRKTGGGIREKKLE